MGEVQTLTSQTIQVWRLHVRVTRKAQRLIAQLIGEHKDHVGIRHRQLLAHENFVEASDPCRLSTATIY
jgi:hypothetical protein